MNAEAHDKGTGTFNGVTAFFDLLGYKQMLANNESEDAAKIIRDIFHQKPGDVNCERMELGLYGLNPDYLIFADSVLVYLPLDPTHLPGVALSRFVQFCSQLTGELLASGLPVRGAITKGKFSIIAGKSFTGKCIVEAHELAQRIEMAACAIAPELETEVLEATSQQQDVCYWPTPVKNAPAQKLLLVDHALHFEKIRAVSRAELISCFGAFKKDIGLDVLPKINNTIHFMESCKTRAGKMKEREQGVP
jgi:hypothetical protein